AYEARFRDDFGSLYTETTLLLSGILVLECRLDEAEMELSALLNGMKAGWENRKEEIREALNSIYGHEDMGFMGTGLTLDELVTESSSDEWQSYDDGSLLNCIQNYSCNSTMQLDSFRVLLLRALKESRLD